MTNTQSPAPGVAAEVQLPKPARRMRDPYDFNKIVDYFTAEQLVEAVRTALQASAAAVEPVALTNEQWHALDSAADALDYLIKDGTYGDVAARHSASIRAMCTALPLPAQVQEHDFVEHSHPEFGMGYFCTPDVFAKLSARTPVPGMDKLISKIWLDDMADDAEPIEITVHGDEVNLKRLQAYLENPRFKPAPGLAGGVVDAATICDAEGARWRKEAQKHLPHHNSVHARHDIERAQICETLARKIRAAIDAARAAQNATPPVASSADAIEQGLPPL